MFLTVIVLLAVGCAATCEKSIWKSEAQRFFADESALGTWWSRRDLPTPHDYSRMVPSEHCECSKRIYRAELMEALLAMPDLKIHVQLPSGNPDDYVDLPCGPTPTPYIVQHLRGEEHDRAHDCFTLLDSLMLMGLVACAYLITSFFEPLWRSRFEFYESSVEEKNKTHALSPPKGTWLSR